MVFGVAILLVAINLRPSLAAIGPLLDEIQRSTGLSDASASLLTSLPTLLMGICLLGGASIMAAVRGRAGIAIGLAAIAFADFLRWQWPSVSWLLLSAVIGGLGIALVQALMPTIIRDRLGPRAAGMMGLYSTAIMGGAALASFAAPRIAPDHGWPAALGVWGMLAIVGLAFWWPASVEQQEPRGRQSGLGIWHSRRAWLLLAFFGLGTSAYTLVLAWLPPYYTGLGWSASDAGALLSGLTLAEVAAGFGVTLAVRHCVDRRPIILLAVAMLFAGLLSLCLAPLPLAWVAALLSGLGIGALFPLGLIVAMDHGRDAAEAGRIASFVQGGGYVLAAFLPLIAGALRQHLSDLTPAWALMAGLSLVLALIATRLRPGDTV